MRKERLNNMVSLFFYYIFFSSAVLYYGIALNRITISINWTLNTVFLQMTKMFFTIVPTTIIVFLISNAVLVRVRLVTLMPFIALLFFISIASFMEMIIRITFQKRIPEFSVSYLIILLTLYESTSVADAFLIPICAILSFAISIGLLHVVTASTMRPEKYNDYSPKKSLAIFSLAIIIIVMLVSEVSWFNKI